MTVLNTGGCDWFTTICAMRIGILAQDGCFASTVASMIDIIDRAGCPTAD
jgi:hypothetical protein